MLRTLAFGAALAALAPGSAVHAQQVVRWLPPEQTIDGYRVYVAANSMTFTSGTDIGYVAPGGNGEAERDVSDLVSPDGSFLVMTAYVEDRESVFSNEVYVPAQEPEPEPEPEPMPEPEPPALPDTTALPPPEDPLPLLAEDFEGYEAGDDPAGWSDTVPSDGWAPAPEIFRVFELPGGERVFGTDSAERDVHSHYVEGGAPDLTSYEVRGRLRLDHPKAKAGVTLYSAYPELPYYYRLQRTKRAFKITTRTESGTRCRGDRKVELATLPEAWYRFRFQATPEADGTRLRASVWPDGTPPPETWMADCLEPRGLRTGGTVGVWSSGAGSKYWDEIEILQLQKTVW